VRTSTIGRAPRDRLRYINFSGGDAVIIAAIAPVHARIGGMSMGSRRNDQRAPRLRRLVVAALLLGSGAAYAAGTATPPDLAPLPAPPTVNPAMVNLGRQFFFDYRLSGDRSVSCASCHDPRKGWSDGQALATGYSAMEYFRNSPTLLNTALRRRFMWDGRLDGGDAGTAVRDMITEAHFMNMDSRLMQERLQQVPEYVALWKKWRGDDINGMRVFAALGEFVRSLQSTPAAFDRYAQGDANALGADAQLGLALFRGKAGCVACHHGPLGTDGRLHATGVPEHPDVLRHPVRTITLLRHYATLGMPNYMNARTDVGAYAVTKNRRDLGRFLTPPLRDLKYTAPYTHNGIFATLDEVIEFYDRGGGAGSVLKPLGLTAAEKRALTAFLLTLSGEPVIVANPGQPDYRVQPLASPGPTR